MYKLIKKPSGKKPEILATFKDKDEARSLIDFLEPDTKRMLFIEGSTYIDGTLYALVAVPTHAIIRAGVYGSHVEVYTTLERLPQDFGYAVYGIHATMDDEDVERFTTYGGWNCVLSGDDFLLVELD